MHRLKNENLYFRIGRYSEFKTFFGASIARDLKAQFANSYLGMAWLILEPLLLVFSLSVIFTLIERPGHQGIPFPLYFYAAVLPWNLVKRCFVHGTQVFRKDSTILSKFAFPKELCVYKMIVIEFVHFLFASIAFIGLMFYYKWVPGMNLLYLAPLLMLQLLFSTGLMLITGSLFVFVRDIGVLVATIGSLWFWFTPIIFEFPYEGNIKYLFYLNPMAGMISAYRQVILLDQIPDLKFILPMLFHAPLFLIVGWAIFSRYEKGFVDEF